MKSHLFLLPNRGVLKLSGPDKASFLQELITNDVNLVRPDQAVYACLLTPQGRFLHDFFIVEDTGGNWLIDCEADRAESLLKKLSLYKLRSQVTIENISGQYSICASFEKPDATDAIIFPDPRHKEMGWRIIQSKNLTPHISNLISDYERQRINLCIPDGSRDMEIDKALIMEFGLDRLNAIDFNKGCYLGQEMTSRMFFRDLVKKNLFVFYTKDSIPAPGTPIMHKGKECGEIRTHFEQKGLALLRKEVATEVKEKNLTVTCGDVILHLTPISGTSGTT